MTVHTIVHIINEWNTNPTQHRLLGYWKDTEHNRVYQDFSLAFSNKSARQMQRMMTRPPKQQSVMIIHPNGAIDFLQRSNAFAELFAGDTMKPTLDTEIRLDFSRYMPALESKMLTIGTILWAQKFGFKIDRLPPEIIQMIRTVERESEEFEGSAEHESFYTRSQPRHPKGAPRSRGGEFRGKGGTGLGGVAGGGEVVAVKGAILPPAELDRLMAIIKTQTPKKKAAVKGASRSERATASHKEQTPEKIAVSLHFEAVVARSIKGKVIPNNKEFDVHRGRNFLEVKTVFPGANSKITVHPGKTRDRKDNFIASHRGSVPYVTIVDVRKSVHKPVYYIKSGIGSFRFGKKLQPTPLKSIGGTLE